MNIFLWQWYNWEPPKEVNPAPSDPLWAILCSGKRSHPTPKFDGGSYCSGFSTLTPGRLWWLLFISYLLFSSGITVVHLKMGQLRLLIVCGKLKWLGVVLQVLVPNILWVYGGCVGKWSCILWLYLVDGCSKNTGDLLVVQLVLVWIAVTYDFVGCGKQCLFWLWSGNLCCRWLW